MKCKSCKKKITKRNKSGYCPKCYPKSPLMLEYQKRMQKEYYYSNPKYKAYKKEYRKKNKKKIIVYQREYQKRNIERVRELKRNWARKNRRDKLNKLIVRRTQNK